MASYGNVSDEVILEYIRTQEATRDDDDFRVEDTRAGRLSRAFSRLPSPPASSRRWISSHTRQLKGGSHECSTRSGGAAIIHAAAGSALGSPRHAGSLGRRGTLLARTESPRLRADQFRSRRYPTRAQYMALQAPSGTGSDALDWRC